MLLEGEATGITGWEELGIVIVGTLAASAVLGGAAWFWRWLHRPVLAIETGTSAEFHKNVGATDEFVRMALQNNVYRSAHLLALRARETRGRSRAKDVVLRVVDVEPPHEDFRAVPLRWLVGGEQTDIQPHGHKDAVVQFVVLYVSPSGTEVGATAAPPIFEHSERIDFTLEVLVDGRKHDAIKMRLENGWPEQLLAYEGPGDFPDPIPFPTLTRASEPRVRTTKRPFGALSRVREELRSLRRRCRSA